MNVTVKSWYPGFLFWSGTTSEFFVFLSRAECAHQILTVLVLYTLWILHQEPLTFVASRSGLTRYLLGIHFWFLGKASSLCQNIWLISHKISLKMYYLVTGANGGSIHYLEFPVKCISLKVAFIYLKFWRLELKFINWTLNFF